MRADLAADFQAISIRQHQIEDYDMRGFPFMQREAARAVLGVHHLKTRLAKILNEHPGKTGIVFDQEKAFAYRGYRPISINRDASGPTHPRARSGPLLSGAARG